MQPTFVFLLFSSLESLSPTSAFVPTPPSMSIKWRTHRVTNHMTNQWHTTCLLMIFSHPHHLLYHFVTMPTFNKSSLLAPVPSWTATCALLQSARTDLEAGPTGSRALLKGLIDSAISWLHLLWLHKNTRWMLAAKCSALHFCQHLKSLPTKRAPQMDLERQQLQSPTRHSLVWGSVHNYHRLGSQ